MAGKEVLAIAGLLRGFVNTSTPDWAGRSVVTDIDSIGGLAFYGAWESGAPRHPAPRGTPASFAYPATYPRRLPCAPELRLPVSRACDLPARSQTPR